MKPKNVFIALTHMYRPSKSQKGKFNVEEECEFLTSLKNKHVSGATFIIDFYKKEVVKTREKSATYEQLINHVMNKYPTEYSELLSLIGDTPTALSEPTNA